jgi:hypothetical protein
MLGVEVRINIRYLVPAPYVPVLYLCALHIIHVCVQHPTHTKLHIVGDFDVRVKT